MTEKELLEKFREEVQIVRTNNNKREGYIDIKNEHVKNKINFLKMKL